MNWQVINAGLMILAGVLAAGAVIFAWRNRVVTGATAFSVLASAISYVLFVYALETFITDLEFFLTLAKLEYVGLLILPVAWLIFSLIYSGYERWITWRSVLLLSVFPAITLALVWTNEWHGLIWATPRLVVNNNVPDFQPEYGTWFWVNFAYVYLVFLVGTLFLLRMAARSWHFYRNQSIAILIASSLPWVANLATVFNVQIIPNLQPLPLALAIACLSLAWAMFRHRLLITMPLGYDMILDNIPDGVLVVDHQNRILALNPPVQNYLDDPQEEAIGKTIEQAFSRIAGQFNGLLQRRTAVIEELDFRQWTVEIRLTPLWDRAGNARGRMFVFRDMTRRKLADIARQRHQEFVEALQSSTALLNSTLELDEVMLLILKTVGRVVKHDASSIMLLDSGGKTFRVRYQYGYEPAQSKFLQEHIFELARFDTFQYVLRTGKPLVIPNTADYADWGIEGEPAHIRSYACAPIRVGGQIIGFLNLDAFKPDVLTYDVLERLQIFAEQAATAIKNAQLYQQVRQLEQIKTDMIRVAAHDLRNPLSAIMGFMEMLLADAHKLDSGMQKKLEGVDTASQRMLKIIDNILSLERIENIAEAKTIIRFNLRYSIEEAIREYLPRATEKFQKIEFKPILGQDSYVRGDPVQIYEAIINLISNAIKYSPEHALIEVYLEQEFNELQLRVVDYGFGIPAGQQDRLFKPFHRIITAETNLIEGTGLGLHLVKSIVERHHGRMIFDSTHGKGSTFGFALPLDDPY